MPKSSFPSVSVLLTLLLCFAAGAQQTDLNALRQSHQWFAFRDAVQSMAKPPDIVRGMVACRFNDLKGGEEFMLRAFAQFPDMSVEAHHASSLSYEQRRQHIEIPVGINGVPGTYILDTGAGFSAICESEARRLGMRLVEVSALPAAGFAGATGSVNQVGVADRVGLGGIQLRNVPFLVFSDAAMADLLPARNGALGIQVLIACETIRWNDAGVVELGFRPPERRDTVPPNLYLDNFALHAQVEFEGQKLDFAIDTGSYGSRLDESFAKLFPATVKAGRQDKWTSGGFAGQREHPARILPEIELKLGQKATIMRPAPVVSFPGAWGHGLLGLDVFKSAHAVTLDFASMMLTVE
jgi:predicted aspartyl protease